MDENKVVCNCFGVTVADIKKAIAEGAKSFEDVEAATGLGTGCGQCVDSAKDTVNKLL